LLKIALILKI